MVKLANTWTQQMERPADHNSYKRPPSEPKERKAASPMAQDMNPRLTLISLPNQEIETNKPMKNNTKKKEPILVCFTNDQTSVQIIRFCIL